MFLPMTFQKDFAPFLGDTLPGVLSGLADDSALIRDTAMRAANVMIERFSTTSVDLLLTELSKCLFHSNPSVRQSSVELLGDLLAQLMGKSKLHVDSQSSTSGIMMAGSVEDYETMMEKMDEEVPHGNGEGGSGHSASTTASHSQKLKALTDAIGFEMYRNTLASIYLLRFDPVVGVRHSSMTVWRKLVQNTPRQLKEIFTALLQLVLKYLNKDNVWPSKSLNRSLSKDGSEKTTSASSKIRAQAKHVDVKENALSPNVTPKSKVGAVDSEGEAKKNKNKDEDSDEDEEEEEEEEDAMESDEDDDEDHAVLEGSKAFAVAASTLDDVVRKLGDAVFPLLLRLLTSQLSTYPKGVCLSISVILSLCPKHLPIDMTTCFSNCITLGLNHGTKSVREASVLAFNELVTHSGPACITSVLTPMLSQLPSSMLGLELVIKHKGYLVLPTLLPTILESNDSTLLPLLSRLLSLSSLRGNTVPVLRLLLNGFTPSLIPSIQALLSHQFSEPILEQLNDVLDEYSLKHLQAKCTCISVLVTSAPLYLKQGWLAYFIATLPQLDEEEEEEEEVSPFFIEGGDALMESLDVLVKNISKEELDDYITVVANGFSKYSTQPKVMERHPRGPSSLLQVILQSLMYGTLKEPALRALLKLITFTPSIQLKAHLIPMTGPLIRMLGDRVNLVVRRLTLECVASLLKKNGVFLKPFLPQLSRSLLKQLDYDDAFLLDVTQLCFKELFPLHPRPDTLLQELCCYFKDATLLDAVQTNVEQVVLQLLCHAMMYLEQPSLVSLLVSKVSLMECNLSSKFLAMYLYQFPEEGWLSLQQLPSPTYKSRIYYYYLEKHHLSSSSSSSSSHPPSHSNENVTTPTPTSTTLSSSIPIMSIPHIKDILQFMLVSFKDPKANELLLSFLALMSQFFFLKHSKLYQLMCLTLDNSTTSYLVKRCLLHSFMMQVVTLSSEFKRNANAKLDDNGSTPLNDLFFPLLKVLLKGLKTKSTLKPFLDQCLVYVCQGLHLHHEKDFQASLLSLSSSKYLTEEELSFLIEYHKKVLKGWLLLPQPPLPTNEDIIASISVDVK
ncbi:translational activator of GCN4 [Coelomomyces lativittatus]|nr:translational activator of GCN4 [Coelomomyces lativittatus]